MTKTNDLQRFWEKNIKKRFDERTLNTQIRLFNGLRSKYVNLDNAATTSPFKSVLAKINQELTTYGSVHRGAGKKSKISTDLFEESRETIKEFVNANDDDYVVFCPNTTVGMNQLASIFSQIKGKILVSDIEHSSSWLPWITNEGKQNVSTQCSMNALIRNENKKSNEAILSEGLKKVITYKTNKNFEFDLENIKGIFQRQNILGDDEQIKVLVVTGASNVTGYKPPLRKLAEIAHKFGAMIVVDACQLLQHEKIDMQEMELDFVVFSGHKMYAPFGQGAIVGNKQIFDSFLPYQIGGGNLPYITSEKELIRYETNLAHDPGTPNFVGARAIHHAIMELENIGVEEIKKYEHQLTGYAYNQLENISGVNLYVKKKELVYDRSMIVFNIDGFDSQLLAEVLNNEFGIGTRAGSYCVYEFGRRINKFDKEKELALIKEIENGMTANIPGAVRVSFSLINSPKDVDQLVVALQTIASANKEKIIARYEKNTKTGEWGSRK